MSERSGGWRSARWRGGAGGSPMPGTLAGATGGATGDASFVGGAGIGANVGGVAPSWGRRPARATATVAPAMPASQGPVFEERYKWPWQGVDWSLGYIAFLGYVFIISSYVVNIGQILMITAILAVTFGGGERWRLHPALIVFTLFIVEVALTYKVTQYAYYDTKPLQDILKVLLITAVAVAVLNSRARIRFFMFWYLAAFAMYPVRGGVFNWFFYRATTQGRVAWNNLFENPNDFAALMIFPLGICVAVLCTERTKLVKQAAFAGLAVMPMVIFMTQSRGAILAIGGGVFAFFLLQGKGRMKSFLSLAGIAVVVFIFAPRDVWTRMANLKSAASGGNLRDAGDSNSAAQRFEIWKVAWAVHQDFPIVGVGWAGYPIAHSDFARRTGFEKFARGARDAHNTYLTLLTETGWVGFLLWSTMIGIIVSGAIKAMRRVRQFRPDYALQIKMLLLALLSYGMAGVFGSFGAMSFTYIHLATIIAATIVTNNEVNALARRGMPTRSAA